ncbi:Cellulose synthase-like protein H1 [Zea mays]|uniref:Cellulose synthase-like protein H1 n=1 Tax=Zea mays TaxID=4577 RepID=A0A3L6FPN5_MAIZE|nr:Cellulose synthase-like protein H1 [Zea mays]
MASANKQAKLQLQERVPLPRTAWKLADLAVLSLLLALLARRASSLVSSGGTAAACTWCWVAALICEAWFTVVWLLNMNAKWNPVRFVTHPERLAGYWAGDDELLPAVDMFVTTADPKLEPAVVTVNTVLSLLALDYPAGKLSCYVSDDGCSAVTCYALREAAEFAKLWVPFTRKHGAKVRAPFAYFSSSSGGGAAERGGGGGVGAADADAEFLRAWTSMKNEYEELVRRIESAEEGSLVRRGDGAFAEFVGADRGNHPTIIKVLWDNDSSKSKSESESDQQAAGDGVPSLIYVSREKSRTQPHHFKAGAMNVLTRVSAVLSNAPIMLNVDCDMFANNPQAALHAMCLLLGFDDEVHSGFVQAPQRFYGGLADDPFGNQMQVIFEKVVHGIAGLQGIFYCGTGCFHRRKVMYGVPPGSGTGATKVQSMNLTGGCAIIQALAAADSPSYKELQKKFGSSKELIESARSIITSKEAPAAVADLTSRVEVAKQVSACSYETGTSWGQEVGWVYGSMTEDVLTGQRIHAAGWRSALLSPDPPAFLGGAPTGGPASLTQYKRWATGLLEIVLSRHNPFLLSASKRLRFRQCLAYLVIDVWPASEPGFVVPLALFLAYNAYNLGEYVDCRLSARAWWNNQRMQRITSSSAWLLAFLTVVLKTVGLSETVFEVTRKEQQQGSPDGDRADADPGRFTFDSSPVFVPPAALAMLSVVAVAVGAWRAVTGGGGGPGVGEFVCCAWLLLCFWPFVRGLVGGRGSHGIPWSVRIKAALLVAAFVHLSTRK